MIVVDNHSDLEAHEDLRERLPSDVKLVRNDRPAKCVASGRNKIWSLVRSKYFVMLHHDVLVTRKWLANMISELEWAETHFEKPCAITPTFIPYPLLNKKLYERFNKSGHLTVGSIKELDEWCRRFGIPCIDGVVWCKSPLSLPLTDDGHQLMIFVASKRFRDVVGEWDERYIGANWDDCDMGLTAIIKGCMNLQSHTTYIHHLQGLSIGYGALRDYGGVDVNAEAFIKKWGRDVFEDLRTGRIWRKIRENPNRYCYNKL